MEYGLLFDHSVTVGTGNTLYKIDKQTGRLRLRELSRRQRRGQSFQNGYAFNRRQILGAWIDSKQAEEIFTL